LSGFGLFGICKQPAANNAGITGKGQKRSKGGARKYLAPPFAAVNLPSFMVCGFRQN
jgi:hypothetical protein